MLRALSHLALSPLHFTEQIEDSKNTIHSIFENRPDSIPASILPRMHVGHILRSVDLCVAFRQGVTYEHVALVGTEQDADRWIVTFVHLLTGVVVDIHLHLANVLMGEIFCFEIDQDETFQNVVVKHEVDVEMAAFDVEMFLPGNERKASAEFKQELLQMIDKRLLKIGFIEMLVLWQIEEFQHIGVFDDLFILWFGTVVSISAATLCLSWLASIRW